jgi:2-pyrone-4,6-dicarboxylate lactonase
MIIEWNNHMFSGDLERFPLHPDSPYNPGSPDGDPLDIYMAHMDREGIDRAVLVQPGPYWEDHRLIMDCLERQPQRFKGVCLFRPEYEGGPERMAELVEQQPLFIAFRFHLLGGKKLGSDSILEPGVQALWLKALELGLIIELHMDSTYALPVANMLREYPQTTVVIDHLVEAGFKDGTPVEFANVLDLAGFEKVYMKLSGLNHFAKDEPHYLSARPFTRRVIAEFGPDQLVWGSGAPGIVDAHMPEYSAAERQKVKGGNLQRLLGFD